MLILLAGGVGLVAPPEPTDSQNRDDIALMGAVALLEATDEFRAVIPGAGPDDDQGPGGDRVAICWLDTDNWDELSDGDAGDATQVQHKASVTVWIEVRDHDPARSLARMTRLESVVMNALDGVSLGGVTFPPFTYCRRGRRVRAGRKPTRRHVMTLEWAYMLPGPGEHSTIDEE